MLDTFKSLHCQTLHVVPDSKRSCDIIKVREMVTCFPVELQLDDAYMSEVNTNWKKRSGWPWNILLLEVQNDHISLIKICTHWYVSECCTHDAHFLFLQVYIVSMVFLIRKTMKFPSQLKGKWDNSVLWNMDFIKIIQEK